MITTFVLSVLMLIVILLLSILSKASKNFTPKLRIIEFVTKGGDSSYQAQIKPKLFSQWYIANTHNIKHWCIEQGKKELKRVIDAAIAKEKTRVIRIVPHDIKE